MNRREFCRRVVAVGGMMALGPIVKAAAADVPRLTESAKATKIALVKTADRSEGVRRALELLGTNPVRASRVLLKPNLNSADEAPGSTHPDVLRSLVVKLNDMGARSITVGDRSGMGDTRRVIEQKGIFDLSKELGFKTVVFDELSGKDWADRRSKDYHWSQGYAVPKMLLDAERVVQTCNLKTHRYGGHFTLSLKNSVGFAAKTINGDYNYMNELHSSPYQRHMIAEINTSYAPSLIVMDGVEAFAEGGPDRGKRVRAEVVLAGTDRIAMDAVGRAYAGLRKMRQPDYSNVKNVLDSNHKRGNPPNVVSRAQLGLPIVFFFSSLNRAQHFPSQGTLDPVGANRRASPLLLHLEKLASGKLALVVTHTAGDLLPGQAPRVEFKARGRSPAQFDVPPQPDLIAEFIRTLQAREVVF